MDRWHIERGPMILLRHFFVALLPWCLDSLRVGVLPSRKTNAGRLVGPICRPQVSLDSARVSVGFQMAGTLLGCLIAIFLGRLVGKSQPDAA